MKRMIIIVFIIGSNLCAMDNEIQKTEQSEPYVVKSEHIYSATHLVTYSNGMRRLEVRVPGYSCSLDTFLDNKIKATNDALKHVQNNK